MRCIFSHLLVYAPSIRNNELLSLCFRWIWIPGSFLFLIVCHGEIVTRWQLEKFFSDINFGGYDRKFPRYMNSTEITPYLKRISFVSKIPIDKWKEAKPIMEMFFKKKIHSIEQRRGNITITEIYLIQVDLPNFIAWRDKFMQEGRKFAIGISCKGQEIWDAADLGHGLVAGSTGQGKTALLRCIIHQAIQKRWNVQVLDFKGGGDYAGFERENLKYRDLEDNGYGRFVTASPEEARELLLALSIEVKSRLDCFKKVGVSNIDEYNAKGREQFIPWLLVVDEAAEILDVRPKDKEEKEMYAEINQYLRTMARISRAAGVHILMGFIRPSSDVLDGQIKNNLLWRACGYFADPSAARIVLDNDRATDLPPEIKGRFIIGENQVQAYYLPVPPMLDESIR